MLHLRIEHPNDEIDHVTLDLDRITVGRAPTCDLTLFDQALSRRHALIERAGDGWGVSDLGSSNGTFLNGKGLFSETRPLFPGDVLRFGRTVVTVEGGPGDSGPGASLTGAVPHALGDSAQGRAVEAREGGGLLFQGKKGTFRVLDPRPFAYGRISVLLRGVDRDDRAVCVKLFHGVRRDTWRQAEAFEREVTAQATLDHPNILPILDYGLETPDERSPFVILPFCEGGDLRQMLQQRAYWPLPTVVPILTQLAQAIDFAHAAGFIHGDVKPENVLFLGDRSRCYLSDFGISRYFAFQEEVTTQVGGFTGGTTAYLSPEQVKAEQSSPLSDVYALAMVAYELLTGRLPFDTRKPPVEQMMAKAFGEPTDPHLYNSTLPNECRDALLAALQREPARRPRSAGEFLARLAGGPSSTKLPPPVPGSTQGTVFVSYSHADAAWLARIRTHLRPLEMAGRLELWDDTRIRPGHAWKDAIAAAMDQARVAILLVSAEFLASAFIDAQEVPVLLAKARRRGCTIMPVIVSPCRFEETPGLADFQSLNPPSRTLVEMSDPEQERLLLRLATEVERALRSGTGS